MNRSADTSALDELIAALVIQIDVAVQLGCADAAQLLRMSRLALQMKRYSISDAELRSFCNALAEPRQAGLSISKDTPPILRKKSKRRQASQLIERRRP